MAEGFEFSSNSCKLLWLREVEVRARGELRRPLGGKILVLKFLILLAHQKLILNMHLVGIEIQLLVCMLKILYLPS